MIYCSCRLSISTFLKCIFLQVSYIGIVELFPLYCAFHTVRGPYSNIRRQLVRRMDGVAIQLSIYIRFYTDIFASIRLYMA